MTGMPDEDKGGSGDFRLVWDGQKDTGKSGERKRGKGSKNNTMSLVNTTPRLMGH